jgi:glycosyltransferase involved in cell wall biosynthesis
VVVALTDPPLIGVIAWLAACLRGAMLVHWVQDIYPEIAIQVTGHRWPAIFRPLRNFAWRRAALCLVPGADMAQTLLASGLAPARILVSPNWAPAGVAAPPDDAVNALRQAWGLTGKFVAAYSGNLGRVHDLAPLLEVAAALHAEPEFVFLFVGHGARRDALERAARARGLTNVHFRPPQPREHLAASLAVGEVHFVTLLPGAERFVFPSKLYGVAQVGRPVIFVGAKKSELAALLEAHGFGAAFTRDDAPAIAAFLRQLRDEPAHAEAMRARARAFGAPGFSDAVVVWDRLMRDELAARPESL